MSSYGGYPLPSGSAGRPLLSRPGRVTTAAVLGFILGALATVAAIFLFSGGALLTGADDGWIGLGSELAGVLIVLGLIVAAIAVLMIWGSVLALTGRSRVVLIVGASLVAALGVLSLLGSLGYATTDASGILSQLIALMVSILIVVLLSLAPSAQYFATQQARRR